MKSKQKSLDKYVLYLETLNSSTINLLDDYVAENVRFKDPFNDVMGSEKMKAVFLHLFDIAMDSNSYFENYTTAVCFFVRTIRSPPMYKYLLYHNYKNLEF